MSKLNIYKASAGSGKTFALTLEYFKIIFSFPQEYKNILAVTFTNKATEEMKNRIIGELHLLAEGEKSSYGPLLCQRFGYTEEQLKNRATVLRTLLLHDYGRIAVTTIDRFFQKIIKSFTRELGIFPGYNVELDTDFILAKATDKMMVQLKKDRDLRLWISELMETNVDEGKSWSIKAKIADLGEELFKENYMLFDKKVLDKFNDKSFLKTYQNFLQNVVRTYEEELEEISREAIEIIEQNQLELKDFRNGKTGCVSHFYKIREKKYDELTQTVRDSIDNLEYWYTKTCKADVKEKIETVFSKLNPLLGRCVQLYDDRCKYYLSARHLLANLYQLGILNDLYRKVREYCEEKNLMLLSDTTYILNTLIEGNDTPFLFEKVGNYYKHLMIDEFQDTSSMQWRNFRPLVINCLSEGHKALIVGDVKQSIYRWRNGDWSLLAGGVEKEFRQLGTKNVVLQNNWRSAREIVDFNNLFFREASTELKRIYDETAGAANPWSEAIEAAYDQAEQKVQTHRKGYVDFFFGPSRKEENCEEAIMNSVVGILLDILKRGGQPKDIVILVRSGKEGAFVAQHLIEYNKTALQPINFISNDSLYIWTSPYVKFLVSVLRYIIEPFDFINKANLLFFYHSFVNPHPEEQLDRIFKAVEEENLFQFLHTDFDIHSGKWMSYSLYETVETIIDKFSLKGKKEEIPYLIAFQDIVFDYEANNSNNIHFFLEWWEKEQSKKVLTTSEEANAVRILTIHKSKGLEFEYVILPFCSWELDSTRPMRRIWCTNHEKGFDVLDYAPLNYSAKLAGTIFEKNYFDEHLKAYVDNLNLLYVALTRAKKELYVRPYMPKINKDGSVSLTEIGAFIYRVMEKLKKNENLSFFQEGSMNIKYGEKEKGREKGAESRPLNLENYPVYDPEERICVKYKYADYTSPECPQLLPIDEGKLLHEIFKSIKYSKDIEKAVREAYLAGLILKKEREAFCQKIRSYIDKPEVKEWFDPKYEVVNERNILFHLGSRLRPDRVLVNGNNVFVIDYKFGIKEEKSYIRQIRYYCSALKEMGYQKVKGYIWYVNLNKIIETE